MNPYATGKLSYSILNFLLFLFLLFSGSGSARRIREAPTGEEEGWGAIVFFGYIFSFCVAKASGSSVSVRFFLRSVELRADSDVISGRECVVTSFLCVFFPRNRRGFCLGVTIIFLGRCRSFL